MWSVLFRDACIIWENQFSVITGIFFVIAFVKQSATEDTNLNILSLDFIAGKHRFKMRGNRNHLNLSGGT